MAKPEGTKYNYEYGSAARAYVEPLEPLKVPTTQEPKRKVKARPREKVDFAFGVQLAICGTILFTCSIIYINSFATLRTKQNQLNALKTEKIAVTNAISKAEAEMTKKLDLEQIREKAEKLGLKKPLAHQIVYIQLPEKSYTTYN